MITVKTGSLGVDNFIQISESPNMVDWKQTGSAIRAARKAKGLNQTALGELTGLSQSAVSDIEKGNSTTLATLATVLRAVGLVFEVSIHSDASPPKQHSPEVLAAAAVLGSMPPEDQAVAVEMLRNWDKLSKPLRRGAIEQWKLYVLSASMSNKKRSTA